MKMSSRLFVFTCIKNIMLLVFTPANFVSRDFIPMKNLPGIDFSRRWLVVGLELTGWGAEGGSGDRKRRRGVTAGRRSHGGNENQQHRGGASERTRGLNVARRGTRGEETCSACVQLGGTTTDRWTLGSAHRRELFRPTRSIVVREAGSVIRMRDGSMDQRSSAEP